MQIPGPQPDLLNQNMHFTKLLGDVYLLKLEKHCLQSIQSTLLSQLNFTERKTSQEWASVLPKTLLLALCLPFKGSEDQTFRNQWSFYSKKIVSLREKHYF